MAVTLTQTALGPLYLLSTNPTTVTYGAMGAFPEGVEVFKLDRTTDTNAPAVDATSIFKYYATALNLSTPAELRIDLNVSVNNTTWTNISSVSRYIGKETLNLKNIEGSFMFGSYRDERYFSVRMALVGTASTDTLAVSCGLSMDKYSATSAGQVMPPLLAIPGRYPNGPLY